VTRGDGAHLRPVPRVCYGLPMHTDTAAQPAPTAFAVWTDSWSGSSYFWPQATADNRPSRVRARIINHGICSEPVGLRVFRDEAPARAYEAAIHAE
jgi:hypothetical protein